MTEQAAAPAATETPVQSAPAEAAPKEMVAPATPVEQKKEIERQLKKFKLKVDGEEIEEEVDLNNEQEMVKRFQLAKAAQRRMQESSELEKKVERFIDMLRKDPRAILSHPDIGVDLKQFAQGIINQELEEQQKSPEQKEKERLERELAEIKEKYASEKKMKEQEEFTRLQAEQEEKITNEITGALDTVGLPKTEETVKRMAAMMAYGLENNVELSIKDIASWVKDQMKAEYYQLLRSAPDDMLEQFVGKDIEDRLQKRRVANYKKPVESASSIKPGVKTEKKEVSSKKKSISDFLNE